MEREDDRLRHRAQERRQRGQPLRVVDVAGAVRGREDEPAAGDAEALEHGGPRLRARPEQRGDVDHHVADHLDRPPTRSPRRIAAGASEEHSSRSLA